MNRENKPREIKHNPEQEKEKIMGEALDVANSLKSEGRKEIISDPQGSYTGTAEQDEKPVQDVDDI